MSRGRDSHSAVELLQQVAEGNITASEALFIAAKEGHETIIETLMGQGDVNAHFVFDRTPLHNALLFQNFSTARKLMEMGANIHATDMFGNNALHIASSADNSSGNIDIVRELIGREGDVRATNKEGSTPLHKAALAGNIDIACELKQHDADLNATNQNNETPLDFALLRPENTQYSNMITALIIMGADPSAMSCWDRNMLPEVEAAINAAINAATLTRDTIPEIAIATMDPDSSIKRYLVDSDIYERGVIGIIAKFSGAQSSFKHGDKGPEDTTSPATDAATKITPNENVISPEAARRAAAEDSRKTTKENPDNTVLGLD